MISEKETRPGGGGEEELAGQEKVRFSCESDFVTAARPPPRLSCSEIQTAR